MSALVLCGRILLRGLFAVLPIGITVALLFWLGALVDGLCRDALEAVARRDRPPAGTGLLAGLVIVFMVGLFTQIWSVRKFFLRLEAQVKRVPVVKALYSGVQDMIGLFADSQSEELSRVVVLEVGEHRFLGFVTRDAFDDLPEGIGEPGHVAVYIPMGYQIGGFTTIVPRETVRPVDMSFEEAMKFVLTAGVKKWTDPEKPDLLPGARVPDRGGTS